MSYVPLVGYVAGALTTIAYLPQALRTFRTKSSGDLSLGMLLCVNTGMILWLCYGFLIHSVPVMIPNVITMTMSLPLTWMKFRYDAREREAAETRSLSAAAGD